MAFSNFFAQAKVSANIFYLQGKTRNRVKSRKINTSNPGNFFRQITGLKKISASPTQKHYSLFI